MRALRDPSIDISHAPHPTSEYSSADLHQLNDQYPLDPQLAWPRGGDELIKGVMTSLSALSELLSCREGEMEAWQPDGDRLVEQLLTRAELVEILFKVEAIRSEVTS